jgi:hypothetical protein
VRPAPGAERRTVDDHEVAPPATTAISDQLTHQPRQGLVGGVPRQSNRRPIGCFAGADEPSTRYGVGPMEVGLYVTARPQ